MTLSQKQAERFNSISYSVTPPFPKELFLEVNNTCNHHCFFCSNSKMQRSKEFIDDELAKRVMNDAFKSGATDITFYATGEPLVFPKLAEYIQYAKNIGYLYVFLTTNGSLSTDAKMKSIIDAGLDSVKFSINAGSRESYLKVHGKDDFDKVVESVRRWYDYKKQTASKIKIFVSFIPTHETIDEYALLMKQIGCYLDEKVDERQCSNQGGNMIENNKVASINPSNILGTLKENQYTTLCPDPFNRAVVSSEGFLTACVVDYQNALTIADLRDIDICSAWNSDVFQALRKKHLDGDLSNLICDNCINNCSKYFEPLTKKHFKPFGNI